jgi:hypothetical protein
MHTESAFYWHLEISNKDINKTVTIKINYTY